jgi:hypothetical protein
VYTIHSTHTQYTHLAGPFEFCDRIFGQGPTIRKSPIPFPHLYIYMSLHLFRLNWQVYRVSPLWNVQYKKAGGRNRRSSPSNPVDLELSIATRQEYDEVSGQRVLNDL